MLLTSETTIKGAGEVRKLGPVNGEYVLDEKTYKAILAEIREYAELRSPQYEKILETAKESIINEMKKKAEKIGANAIIGMHLHQEVVSYGRMIITGDGIAVKIEGLYE